MKCRGFWYGSPAAGRRGLEFRFLLCGRGNGRHRRRWESAEPRADGHGYLRGPVRIRDFEGKEFEKNAFHGIEERGKDLGEEKRKQQYRVVQG